MKPKKLKFSVELPVVVVEAFARAIDLGDNAAFILYKRQILPFIEADLRKFMGNIMCRCACCNNRFLRKRADASWCYPACSLKDRQANYWKRRGKQLRRLRVASVPKRRSK